MIVFGRSVIEEAFQQVLGRLAPAILQECIDEFSVTYPVLGTEEAFKNALTAKAPAVDATTHDNLFTRFEGALRLAQSEQKENAREERERQREREKEARTEDEKRVARDEAADLKREVNEKTGAFRIVQNEVRSTNRNILAEAMRIRKLARDSEHRNADPVAAALESLDEIVGKDGEVSRLIKDSDEIAKQVQEAARNGDTATIDDSIAAAQAISSRLEDIHTVDIAEAEQLVEDAITAAEAAKIAEEAKAATQATVTKAQADLDAIDGTEGIAAKVAAAVQKYKEDVVAQTGTVPPATRAQPTDPPAPDELVTAANDALAAARTANQDVVSRAGATPPPDPPNDVNEAATRVTTARADAQAALDDINRRANAIKGAQAIETSLAGHKENERKKTDEEKAKKAAKIGDFFKSGWGLLTTFALFVVAVAAVLFLLPTLVQIGAVVAVVVVLVIAGISLLKGKPEAGTILFGGYFVVVLVAFIVLGLMLLIGKGPGSDNDVIPGNIGAEATATPTPTLDASTDGDFVPHPTKTPD